MAEVGLVEFAKCAVAIAKRVMPLYGSKYSKHTFTQPQLLAMDATGLVPGAISTFFINRKKDHGQGLPWRYWLKWIVVVETRHQLLLAQLAKRGPYTDCALLRPLLDIAHPMVPASFVLADAEFDRERNHKHIRDVHHLKSIIPAGVRAQMKAKFPTRRYRQRNLIETIFSVVKRKLSARVP